MGRHIKDCGRTVELGSSGGGVTVTTPCDCACEGCCCQWITYGLSGVDLTVDFDWDSYFTPDSDFLACLGVSPSADISEIKYVGVYFDFCPPYPDDHVVPFDYDFELGTGGARVLPPLVIPFAADAECITLVFYNDYFSGISITRCTVKFTT